MAWSSYAHLPNREDEYWEILSKIEDDMPVAVVDKIIAIQKNKEKVQHHYRSNLAIMGFFGINNNFIKLNYDLEKLSNDKKYLRNIFQNVLKNNNEKEVQIVGQIVKKLNSYELKYIVDELIILYPLIDYNSFIRWIRPLVSLMKFADILSKKDTGKHLIYTRYLQEAYLKIANAYADAIALEILEIELKKIDSSLVLVSVLDKVLNDHTVRFKIELLMMPNWATKYKSYKIYQDLYTHIKIKDDLLGEE